jgi:hypothetical protein
VAAAMVAMVAAMVAAMAGYWTPPVFAAMVADVVEDWTPSVFRVAVFAFPRNIHCLHSFNDNNNGTHSFLLAVR